MAPADALSAYCADAADRDRQVTEQLERHLFDWIGLVAAGRSHAGSTDSVLDAVEGLSGETGHRIPTGNRLDPDRAALVAGTLAHSLDFDDTHRESSLHPGAPVIAAALPVSRAVEATGEELLDAISLGYDVACALGRAVGPDAHYARGFHLTATCGTFGATAAAGHLRGFDDSEFEAAFGVNGSQAAGSLQFLENGAWNKRLHPGLAASRGVLAAELAAAGFRGAADPIEGEFGFLHGYTDDPRPEVLASIEPGRAVRETALKPYPCCRYTHAAIDGLLDLRPSLLDDAGGPEPLQEVLSSVRIDLPSPGVRLTGAPIERKRRPANFVDCQFSMPFAAALALSTGEAGLPSFLDAQERLDDPTLRSLMDRVEVVSTDRTNVPFPERWTAHVEVTVDGGASGSAEAIDHERFVEYPLGEPEKPMSRSAVEEKFTDLATGAGVTPADASSIVDAVGGLRSGSTDAVAALLAALDRA